MTLVLYSLWAPVPNAGILPGLNDLEAMLQGALAQIAALKAQIAGGGPTS